MRLFYAAGGGADLAEAYACLAAGRPYPNDVCVPFGNQIARACAELGVPICMVSPKADMASIHTGRSASSRCRSAVRADGATLPKKCDTRSGC